MTGVETRWLRTADGLRLEAEVAVPPQPPAAGVVLCHPHPQYGGSMRSIVISALFGALPPLGFTCVRFNFRGVEASEGGFGQGVEETADVIAALDALHREVGDGVPLVAAGWSFGADMVLAVGDARIAGWLAIAPPLRFRDRFAAASDPRPEHLVLAEHDEFRVPADVEAEIASWRATTSEVIGGASHFFVGRTDRVVDTAARFVAARCPS